MAGNIRAMLRPLRCYADLSGRASRKEYWLYTLFSLALGFSAAIADVSQSGALAERHGWMFGLTSLALVMPGTAVTVRRLHDVGATGLQVKYSLVLGLAGYLLCLAGGIMQWEPLIYAGIACLGGWAALAVFIFVCTLIPGSRRSNQYGPPTPERR